MKTDANPVNGAEHEDEDSKERLLEEVSRLKDRIAQLETSLKDRKQDTVYFAERLTEEIARSKRYKYEFCLLFVEMDNLELFLKKQPKEALAELLTLMDRAMRDTLRTADLICQCSRGGYCIILPYTDSSGGKVAAEKVRLAIERIFMLQSKAVNISLTVSAGLASYPKDAMSEEQMMQTARTVLARAQSDGGNRVYLATESTDSEEIGKQKQSELSNDTFLLALDNEVMRCSRFSQKFSLILLAVTSLEAKDTRVDATVRAAIMSSVFKIMNAYVRTIDKSYLYTDSRFAIMLPHTGPEGTLTVAEKLIQCLSANPVFRNNDVDFNVSVNIGMATFPTDEINAKGLLRKTDEALRHAIAKGANQIALASDMLNLSCKPGRDINDLIMKVKETGAGAIYSLLAAVDVTEHYDHAHSQAVAKYAMATAVALSLPNVTIRHLRIMALVHDLGKACIPDSVISKPGPLDDAEWDLMMKHPQFGAYILQQLSEFSYCCAPVLAHHERPDGKGYPRGLKAGQIPIEAEIIAVAEAYDDMTTPRPYRQQVLPSEAVEELMRQAGQQFNTDVVKAFIKALYSAQNKLLK